MSITSHELALVFVEGGCFCVDHDLKHGQVDRFDDVLGRFMANWAKRTYRIQPEIDFIANGLFLYCGKGALQRFCIEVEKEHFTTAYDFMRSNAEIVKHGYSGLGDCPLLDVYELGKGAHVLDWQFEWCPFRNASEVLWIAGWKRVPEDNQKVIDARSFLTELHGDLLNRAETRQNA